MPISRSPIMNRAEGSHAADRRSPASAEFTERVDEVEVEVEVAFASNSGPRRQSPPRSTDSSSSRGVAAADGPTRLPRRDWDPSRTSGLVEQHPGRFLGDQVENGARGRRSRRWPRPPSGGSSSDETLQLRSVIGTHRMDVPGRAARWSSFPQEVTPFHDGLPTTVRLRGVCYAG
jgi:hypothetical protein